MKVLIAAFHPRTMTPYSKLYEDTIKGNGNDYDIVFWDRFSNAPLERSGNEFIIHRICTLGGKKYKKIPAFFYYRNTLKEIIRRGRYDRIIILNTMPGFLLSDVLLNQYKGHYILDIRDYTYEKYSFYKNRVMKLINNSAFSTISSAGFLRFLDESPKLLINHNISNLSSSFQAEPLEGKKEITIGFIGVIRYEDINRGLINQLKNDLKFHFKYIGRVYPECHLKEYCEKEHFSNVSFDGAFNNDQKPDIYKNIDIINAVYGNNKIEVTSALPNKLYDSIIFKKPMIVSTGTYLAEVVEKYHLGFALDKDDDLRVRLQSFIQSYDPDQFNDTAERLIAKVLNDQGKIKSALARF